MNALPPATFYFVGEAVITLPACVLLAFLGAALSVRRHRLYGLFIVAAGLWLVQTGIGVGFALLEYAVYNGVQAVPNLATTIGPGLIRGCQSSLQMLSWMAIGVALLAPREHRHLQDDALPEDAVA